MGSEVVGEIDGEKLQRPWWGGPAIQTVWIVVLCYALATAAMLFLTSYAPASEQRYYAHFTTLQLIQMYLGWWPLFAGLLISFLGLALGHRFTQGGRGRADRAFGVQYLAGDHPLTRRVHGMADRLGMPRPKVGHMRDANAYAIGSSMNDAAVVLGVPLIKGLKPEELDAVIGHELGHIVSGDMRQMQYAIGFQRMFDGVLAGAGGLLVTSLQSFASATRQGNGHAQAAGLFTRVLRWTIGFGSQLELMRVSRWREFHADAIGAALTSPVAMQSALKRLETIDRPPSGTYACLMFNGKMGWLTSTHPTTERRIAALEGGKYLVPRKLAPNQLDRAA